jgi:curved DNA-binding protein CbpA
MAVINAAWEQIGDPVRRAAYDRELQRTGGPSPAETTSYRSAGPSTDGIGSAGTPPGRPSGSVVDFGRYAGWSLGEIARTDLEYIEWLDRMTIGRAYRVELDAILRQAGRRRSEADEAADRRGLYRRR